MYELVVWLAACFLTFRGIVWISAMMSFVISAASAEGSRNGVWIVAVAILPFAFIVAVGLFLAFRRKRVASFLFDGDPDQIVSTATFADLAVKILGLFVLLSAFGLLMRLRSFSSAPRADSVLAHYGPLLSGVVPDALLFLAALILISRSRSISERMFTPGDRDDGSSAFMGLALGLMGVWFVLSAVPNATALVVELVRQSWGEAYSLRSTGLLHSETFLRTATVTVVQSIIGVSLFLGRRGLAGLWGRVHPMSEA